MENISSNILEMTSFIIRFILPTTFQKISELSSFFNGTILQCMKFNEIELAYFALIIRQCGEDSSIIKEEHNTSKAMASLNSQAEAASAKKQRYDNHLKNILASFAAIAKYQCISLDEYNNLWRELNSNCNNFSQDSYSKIKERIQAKIEKITLKEISSILNILKSPIEPMQNQCDLSKKVDDIVGTSKTKNKKQIVGRIEKIKRKYPDPTENSKKQTDYIVIFLKDEQVYYSNEEYYEVRKDIPTVTEPRVAKKINANKELAMGSFNKSFLSHVNQS